LVLPTSSGDNLYWYDRTNNKYYAWVSNGTAWDVDIITNFGEILDETGNANMELARGDALILVRANPAANSGAIYLSGRYVTGSSTSTAVAGKISLIASPYAEDDVGLNDTTKVNFSSPNVGDYIMRSDGTVYTYKTVNGATKWYASVKVSDTTDYHTEVTVNVYGPSGDNSHVYFPAGQGVWYFSKGESDVTITWGSDS